jgi:heterogeneous nuclear rnp K-like protein 2
MPVLRVRIVSPITSIFPSVVHLLSASPQGSRSPSPTGRDVLTLRALVSTRDAGVIIGKGGKNVADLREQTGVKAGVTKVVPGVHERVLSISGSVESVAKVCSCCRFRA